MLNVSIVIYEEIPKTFEALLTTLLESLVVNEIFVIDNSSQPHSMPVGVNYTHLPQNIGYGRAHNIALQQTLKGDCPYHLVLNPDIQMQQGILEMLVDKMESDAAVGLLMPCIVNEQGEVQHLCKLLPSPSDLIFRRFFPRIWKGHRRDRFEMTWADYTSEMQVPYLSGCFMFLRTEALRQVGLFDPRYFLYPEDIDLSRRIASCYKTIYYPSVKVTHLHKRDSYHSIRMTLVHATQICKYFCKWGWIFDGERNRLNNIALNQFENK